MQRRFLILPVAAAVGLAAEWSGYGWGDPGRWIPDLAVGWCLIGCGFIASARRPESRSGVLMTATGFAWFLGNFAGVGVSVVAWAAAHALYLHRGPLFQLLLTYPSGRRPSRVTGAAIAVFYAAAVITPVWQSETATILLAALLPGVCGYEYARMVGPARRMRLIALQAAAGLGFVLAASAVVDVVIAPERGQPDVAARLRDRGGRRRGRAAGRPPPRSWGGCRGRRSGVAAWPSPIPDPAVGAGQGDRRPGAGGRLLASRNWDVR